LVRKVVTSTVIVGFDFAEVCGQPRRVAGQKCVNDRVEDVFVGVLLHGVRAADVFWMNLREHALSGWSVGCPSLIPRSMAKSFALSIVCVDGVEVTIILRKM
jgi:hypothetical protein